MPIEPSVETKRKQILEPERPAARRRPDTGSPREPAPDREAALRMLRGGVTAGVVSSPGDRVEREADQIARDLLRSSATPRGLEAPAAEERSTDRLRPLRPSARSPRPSGGEPLPAPLRQSFEPRLGSQLGDVRLHTDSRAAATAEALDARAFALGSDIFFAPGQYRPHSSDGRELLAHELAHVVQSADDPAMARRLLRRANESRPGSGESGERAAEGVQPTPILPSAADVPQSTAVAGGRLDLEAKEIVLPVLSIPEVGGKMKGSAYGSPTLASPLTIPRAANKETRNTRQWDTTWLASKSLEKSLKKKLRNAFSVDSGDGHPSYFLQSKTARIFLTGTFEAILARVIRPFWNKLGVPSLYHVDHITELQLGGQDSMSNFWLLQATANMSSGSRIHSAINDAVARLLTSLGEAHPELRASLPDVAEARADYDITFSRLSTGRPAAGGHDDIWTRGQMAAGAQLDPFLVLDASAVERQNLRGSSTQLSLFFNRTGGGQRNVEWGEGAESQDVSFTIGNFLAHHILYRRTRDDRVTGRAFKGSRLVHEKELTFSIEPMPGVDFGGHIPASSIRRAANGLIVKWLSPVEVFEADLVEGVGTVIRGRILVTAPLIAGQTIDFELLGDDVTFSRTFGAGALDLPGPLSIPSAHLTVGGDRGGLHVRGEAQLELADIGRGQLQGDLSHRDGLKLIGSLDFDSQLFSPARVELTYEDEQLSGRGTLGIPEGRLPGIREARLSADYRAGELNVRGDAALSIPGVESGTIALKVSDAGTVALGGRFALSDAALGVGSGEIDVELVRTPDGRYALTGNGTARADIAGVEAALAVRYDNGELTIEGEGHYQRGLVNGQVRIGLTNRSVDSGRPVGPAGPRLTLYGGGEVTVMLAPWLQGTAGLELSPEGRFIIDGEIALPSSIDLFPERRHERNLMTVGFDVPIVGVAVAGQRVGIFATIEGGVDLEATLGPGTLRALAVGVRFDPEAPEATRVRGSGQLHAGAFAGIRLFVSGGIGAGVPIVSATGSLEVGAQAGLSTVAEAAVDIDGSPSRGLRLQAEAAASARPKLRFDIAGRVLVEADLVLTTVELFERHWQLAAVELGSELQLGMRAPIAFEEGRPFAVPWSRVEFELPELDPAEQLEQLLRRLTGGDVGS